ncbi:hypothetical protein [Salinibacter altiplanensis]|uniref:hypothetical protein n=1 Tax=Salinibacter altiplanensis TaxID=1803181 RepID=UPI000C9F71FF|nr:hypothetical protein [Salinibacter altiplanensis]
MPSSVYTPFDEVHPEAVADWAHETLSSDVALQGDLTGGTSMSPGEAFHRGAVPAEMGPKALITRLRDQAGGTVQSFSGIEAVNLQTMALAAEEAAGKQVFFQRVTARINELLAGNGPSLEGLSVEQPMRRTRVQRKPRWDDGLQRWFQTHTFVLQVAPAG